jgi:hypothetical protein
MVRILLILISETLSLITALVISTAHLGATLLLFFVVGAHAHVIQLVLEGSSPRPTSAPGSD